MRTILLTLLVALLLSGCVSASSSTEAATATPNILPRLGPSSTPSDSTLPLTCQVTDLNVYINQADGYCFAFPLNFTLGDRPSENPNVRGPAVDDSVEPIQATLTVEFLPATDKSLREQAESYLKEFSVADPATYMWTQVPVGGEAGMIVEPIPAMLSYRIVFVQHNGNLFRLMFWPVDIPEARSDLNDLTQTTLGSFAFIR